MGFEIFGLEVSAVIIWLVIAIIFVMAEGISLGLMFIWFAGGALLAMIVSLFIDIWWIQVFAFILGSVILLIYTKPFVKKILKVGETKTNVSSLIGKEGIVIKELQEFTLGQVKLKGQIWSAKPFDGITIKEGVKVEVIKIEGVKLMVKSL